MADLPKDLMGPPLPSEADDQKQQAPPDGPWKCDVCGAQNNGGDRCKNCMSWRAGCEPPSTMGRSISQITLPEPQKGKKGRKNKDENDLRKKFDELDTDGNGSLSFREWCFALNDLGIPWQP